MQEFEDNYRLILEVLPNVSPSLTTMRHEDVMQFVDLRENGAPVSVSMNLDEGALLFLIRARTLLSTDPSTWNAANPAVLSLMSECSPTQIKCDSHCSRCRRIVPRSSCKCHFQPPILAAVLASLCHVQTTSMISSRL